MPSGPSAFEAFAPSTNVAALKTVNMRATGTSRRRLKSGSFISLCVGFPLSAPKQGKARAHPSKEGGLASKRARGGGSGKIPLVIQSKRRSSVGIIMMKGARARVAFLLDN